MQISAVNKHVFGWFLNQNLNKYKKTQIPTKSGGGGGVVFLISESKKQIENPISFSFFFCLL